MTSALAPVLMPALTPVLTPVLRADVLISLLAAMGAFWYLRQLGRRSRPTLIESRTRLLVATAGGLCLLRAPAWTMPEHLGWATAAFAPAPFLPLAMTVFVEGLLRRHAPFGIKVFAIGIAVVASVVNLLRAPLGAELVATVLGPVFAIALAVHMALLGFVLLRRDRRTLARAENRFADAVVATAVVAIPLAVTDFRPALDWPVNRMGGLALLVLLVVLLHRTAARTPRWPVARELGAYVLAAVLATGCLVALDGTMPDFDVLVRTGSIAMALVLLGAVVWQTRELTAVSGEAALVAWLARPVPDSVDAFRRELRSLALTADAELLGPGALSDYDARLLRTELEPVGRVWSSGALRQQIGAGDAAAEQLVDLLERHERTHVVMLRSDPILLLTVASPELPGVGAGEDEIAAVARRAEHVLAIGADSR